MATYVNNLRLKEITTGDEDGTWGVSTNTNLDLIADALGYATQDGFATDADSTTTVADGVADPARAMYLKVTSSATLTTTRTLTIAPNTISRVMYIENATTGSQSIAISQGSGGTVTVAAGLMKIVYLDGAGSVAAVVDALGVLENSALVTADIGVTVQGYDADTTKNDVANTFTATQTLDTAVGTKFVDKVYAAGNTGTAINLDLTNGGVQTMTLTGDATITLTGENATANTGSSVTLILTNDATPSRTVTLAGGTFKVAGGTIARSTGASEIDIWTFFTPDQGTTWYYNIPMKNLS